MVLGKKFFERSTLKVAKNLLGNYLVRRVGGKTQRFIITEVEAYNGFKDKASHAFKSKTLRNTPMFGKAGIWYVYFTYGMHHMLNIVTGEEGYPAAILIRSVLGVNGPGRLTKHLKINTLFNNKKAAPKTELWIENNEKFENSKFKIRRLPRVGVEYAGPFWSKKPWRLTIDIKR